MASERRNPTSAQTAGAIIAEDFDSTPAPGHSHYVKNAYLRRGMVVTRHLVRVRRLCRCPAEVLPRTVPVYPCKGRADPVVGYDPHHAAGSVDHVQPTRLCFILGSY
jgi:hypothetical protein